MIEDLERTWSIRAEPFWPKATQRVRAKVEGFGKERLVAVVNDACFP